MTKHSKHFLSSSLQNEINEVVGRKSCISYEDLSRLNYMNRVWKETLRLYPPAPATAREVTHDTYIGKHFLPAGSFIMVHHIVLQENPMCVLRVVTWILLPVMAYKGCARIDTFTHKLAPDHMFLLRNEFQLIFSLIVVY